MEPDKLLDEDPAVAHSIVGYSPRSTPTSISPLLETVVGFSSLQPLSPLWPVLDLDLDDFDIEHIGSELPSAEPAGDNKATSSAGSGSFGSGSHKKLDHNAYERDRRKKLNDTYSSLRSLLPDVDQNHNKKLSIPTTVCQVLEYIPKLKKQVEGLEKKKEELTRAKCKLGMARTNDGTTPIVSATPLDDKQVMIQVSLLKNTAENLPLSKCIQVLENEGLQLVGSSTFSTFDSSRTFYTLHLQKSQGTMDRVCPTLLCGKLEKAVKGKR